MRVGGLCWRVHLSEDEACLECSELYWRWLWRRARDGGMSFGSSADIGTGVEPGFQNLQTPVSVLP